MYSIIESGGSRGTAASVSDTLVRVIALCRAGRRIERVVDEQSGERLTLSQLRMKAAEGPSGADPAGRLNWQ